MRQISWRRLVRRVCEKCGPSGKPGARIKWVDVIASWSARRGGDRTIKIVRAGDESGCSTLRLLVKTSS